MFMHSLPPGPLWFGAEVCLMLNVMSTVYLVTVVLY